MFTTDFMCEIQGKKQLILNYKCSSQMVEDAFRSSSLRYLVFRSFQSWHTLLEGDNSPFTVNCYKCGARCLVD